MLLYAGPFFAVGAVLLLVPLLSVGNTQRVGADGGARPGVDVALLVPVAAVGLLVTALSALALGWLVAGRFLRPLRAVTATARDISATNLDRRLGLPDRDEFGELAATLDDLFGRLRSAFESQRHFVANASHELRTPLTAERALLQLAVDDPDATVESLRDTCRELLDLNAHQERLVGALLTLATGERGVEHAEPVDLADLARRAADAAAPEARRRGVELHTDAPPAPTTGDRSLLASLVTNLVDNAVRHNTPGGRVRLTTAADATHARLTVSNTGPPVPPHDLSRLFQPFQRLAGDRLRRPDGHGLGLAIVRAVADAHHAVLTPAAHPDGGLTITVDLPRPGRARGSGAGA